VINKIPIKKKNKERKEKKEKKFIISNHKIKCVFIKYFNIMHLF